MSLIANNAGGEKTLAYGKTEEYARSLKVVLSDGKERAIKPLLKTELSKKLKEKGFEGELYLKIYKLIEKNKLEERLAKFKNDILKFRVPLRITRDEAEADKYYTIRRQSFKLLREHSGKRTTSPFIDDFIVQPKHLPEFLPQLNAILDKYKDKIIYTIAGHPGNGNFHIIPMMDLKDDKVRVIIPCLSEEVYDLVLRYGGSITAEHNDGLIRTHYLEKMYGKKIVELFAEVKKIFDPKNIFNPGKKTGMDIKTAMSYVEK